MSLVKRRPIPEGRIDIKTIFRSFNLQVYRHDTNTNVYVTWSGPKAWASQIETGCKMWANVPMGMEVSEFLDRLDIGRNKPKGST